MPPRSKTAATEPPTAPEAAAAEATETAKPIIVPFRGDDFTIERDTFASARFLLAMASSQDHKILFELLGPNQADRFIRLCNPGEGLLAVEMEFFEALNTADGGQGNS
jgi:hypothetical protein